MCGGGRRRARVCAGAGPGAGPTPRPPAGRTPPEPDSAFARLRRSARPSALTPRPRAARDTRPRRPLRALPSTRSRADSRRAVQCSKLQLFCDTVLSDERQKICGVVRCEDCGPAGRRLFERRKGWSAGCEAGGGRREAAHAPAGRPRRGSDTRVDTGARDGRQADRRRGALQPALEQPPGAPAALLRSAAARGDAGGRDARVRRAPRARPQGAAGRVQPALPPDIQREPVQAPRDRAEGLPRMGGAGGGGLYVPRRGVGGARAAWHGDPCGRVAAGARAGRPGARAGAGAFARALTAAQPRARHARALAAGQPRQPAAAPQAGAPAPPLGRVRHAREPVHAPLAQRRPEGRAPGAPALAA